MHLHFFKSVSTLFIAVFFLSGCASIVSTTSYPVNIRTDPKGANISIIDKKGDEIFKGQSPATVRLKSGAGYFGRAEYKVTISSPGYAEKIIPINFKLNGWYWGNILLGGIIGMLIVDPATGAMWKIVDPIINETLVKTSVSASESPSMNVLDISNISKEARAKLIRIN